MTAAGFEARADTWMTSGKGVVEASDLLASAVDALCRELASAGACWGADDIGQAFFHGTGEAAGFATVRDAMLADLEDMVNSLRTTGGKLIVSGKTYLLADEASDGEWALPSHGGRNAVALEDLYQLPPVTASLVDSDPPPADGEWILGLLERLVVGCRWPDGNMSRLASVRNAFTAAAKSADAVAKDVRHHAHAVTASNVGEATQRFTSFAAVLTGDGDERGLKRHALICRKLADWVDALIEEKRAARLQFELSVAFLSAVWAMALATSWMVGGASVVDAFAATAAEGIALRAFLRAVAMGVLYNGGLDAAGQYARVHEGLQKGFDAEEFFTAAGEGAITGGVMGAAGGWIGRQRNPLTTALSSWMESGGLTGVASRFGVVGASGTLGNVAAQLTFRKGHADLGEAAMFGFGMAGLDGAAHAGGRLAGRLEDTARLAAWLDGRPTPLAGGSRLPAGAPADRATELASDAAPGGSHAGADEAGEGHAPAGSAGPAADAARTLDGGAAAHLRWADLSVDPRLASPLKRLGDLDPAGHARLHDEVDRGAFHGRDGFTTALDAALVGWKPTESPYAVRGRELFDGFFGTDPVFMTKGGENLVYGAGDSVVKVDHNTTGQLLGWREEGWHPEDFRADEVLAKMTSIAEERMHRYQALKDFHGSAHVIPETVHVRELEWPGRMLRELAADGRRVEPDQSYVLPTLMTTQEKISGLESLSNPDLSTGYSEMDDKPDTEQYVAASRRWLELHGPAGFDPQLFLSVQRSPSIGRIVDLLQSDPATQAAVRTFVHNSIAYTKHTDEIMDTVGAGNIVFMNSRDYILVDALHPYPPRELAAAVAALHRLNRGEELARSDRICLINVLNYVRTLNALASATGLSQRIDIVPRPFNPGNWERFLRLWDDWGT
ncbi:hypothetical protein [Actinomadura sp. DC4]|uniref:WXG100-like domain-containing protein n=1 Tax=Actinomadura sp. DC4 TaxID=3055069 RepID=UPI0025B09F6D|nr:hypothetical protein [Actinomadura sp. DC4]MDN3354211.1 hypothetical protein [Actinomadura sp. DC4]